MGIKWDKSSNLTSWGGVSYKLASWRKLHGAGRNLLKRLSKRSGLSAFISKYKFLRNQKRIGLMTSHTKWHVYSTSVGVFVFAFLLTFFASSIFTPISSTNAEENTTDNTSADGYSLTLSTTSLVNLDLVVGPVDVMTVSLGNVNVKTNSPGYKLYIGMTGNTTALNGNGISGSIPATNGTITAPASLTRGTWGYAVPSSTTNLVSNGFSGSYTELSSATPDNTKKFAIPPTATNNPDLLATSATATTSAGDTYPIYYGVRANMTTAEGSYTNNVLFTAVADAGASEGVTLTPATAAVNTATTITVKTTLYSTDSSVDANIYFLTTSQYNSISGTNVEALGVSPMSCTRVSNTPLTYSCTVPATSSTGTYYVYVKVPKYNAVYHEQLIVYPAMQNQASIDACVNAATNTSFTLADTRDGNAYTVKKLKDGNCWMTQNIKIAGKTLTPDDSNVMSNYDLPASSTSGWCIDDTEACYNTANVLDATDTSISGQSNAQSNYGTYYSWNAATAGTGTYNMTSGNTTSSVCPKGWRLPTGGSSGEFQSLYNQYNTSANMRDATNGPGFVLSGYRYGSSTYNQGSYGYYWSSTAYSGSRAYRLNLNSSDVNPAGYNGKYNGFSVRCVAETRTLTDITYMQDMTPQIAANTATGTSKTLTDKRDNNTYTVKKLNDGKIWMTQNLRLVGPFKPDKTDSDVTWNKTDTNAFELIASNSGTWCTSNDSGCYNQSMVLDSGNNSYGTYYNWYSATAGTGTYSKSSDNAPSSICPKGWRLPTGGSSGEFQALYNQYSSSANMRDATNGPGFVLSGYRRGSSTSDQGSYGFHWSSTAYSSDLAYDMRLYSSNVDPAYSNSKYFGFSVRCVAY